MRKLIFSFICACLLVFASSQAFAAIGPLVQSVTNPRYLEDTDGNVVFFTGTHTWMNMIDGHQTSKPVTAFDWEGYLDFLEANGMNHVRLWVWPFTTYACGTTLYYYDPDGFPWRRSGAGTARDSYAKYDLTDWNDNYFSRLVSRVAAANARGIYVSIMLFEGYSLQFCRGDDNDGAGDGYFFSGDNNVNSIDDGFVYDDNGTKSGVNSMKAPGESGYVAAILTKQKEYVAKVIDAVNGYPNVLYEVANEAGDASVAWQYEIISYVNTYQATKDNQHPVGMTFNYSVGDDDDIVKSVSGADWVSFGQDNVYYSAGTSSASDDTSNPTLRTGAEVSIFDTDHLGGGSYVRPAAIWKLFMRGNGGVILMEDGFNTSYRWVDEQITQSKYIRDYVDRIDLINMAPSSSIASSGYALVYAANEYLVYNPISGNVTVNLSSETGDWAVEWFNPYTGTTYTSAPSITGGGSRTLNPSAHFTPTNGYGAVLYLTKIIAPSGSTCRYSSSSCGDETSPYTAYSASRDDVNYCVNTCASRGDTVIVPAGSATWSSNIVITKAVTLMGQGYQDCTTGTCITSGLTDNQVAMIWYRPTASDVNTLFRVTGFKFDANSISPVVILDADPINLLIDAGTLPESTIIKKVRIDNNYFDKIRRTTGYYGFPNKWTGRIVGVVDHNIFNAAVTGDAGIWISATHPWDYTSDTYFNGTDEAVFFEDNHFIRSSTAQIIANGQGGAYVLRYNHIDYSTATGSYSYGLDTHGHQMYAFQAGSGGEVYGNKHSVSTDSVNFAELRGGEVKAFYNKSIATKTSTARPAINFWSAYGDTYGYSDTPPGPFSVCPSGTLYAGSETCSSGGRVQYPNKAYAWGNRYAATDSANGSLMWYGTHTGSPSGGTFPCPSASGAVNLRRNTDYWIPYATYDESYEVNPGAPCYDYHKQYRSGSLLSYTNTLTHGVACGTPAQMAAVTTCTNGVGFWATTQSCAIVPMNSHGMNPSEPLSGALYTCNSNNWVKLYEPYQYPHPLVTETIDESVPIYPGGATPSGSQVCATDPQNQIISYSVIDDSTVTCVGCDADTDCSATKTYDEIDAIADKISFTSTNNGTSRVQSATVSNACNTSFSYFARCKDSYNNKMLTSVPIFYTVLTSADTTNPTLSSAELLEDGWTIKFIFSEPIKDGGNYSSGDWELLVDSTPIAVSCSSSAGWGTNTLLCSIASCVVIDDAGSPAITVDYNQPAESDGIQDLAGNPFAIGAAINVTNSSGQTCAESNTAFEHGVSAPSGSSTYAFGNPIELGVRWQSSAAGTADGIYFYKQAADTGTHIGNIWCASTACGGGGTLLGSVTFADETASGWQYQAFSTPVNIIKDAGYIASYFSPTGNGQVWWNYFLSQYGYGDFIIPAYGGRYKYTPSTTYPNQGATAHNYFVDVEMTYSGVAGPWQVTTSKTGNGCTISESQIIVDSETAEVTATLKPGWKALWSGTCGGSATGNVYTTAAITADCTVIATCESIKILPWLVP